jgi:hypothetical protein
MKEIIWTEAALDDIERIAEYLPLILDTMPRRLCAE